MIGTSEEESKHDDEESTQQQPPPSRKRKRSSELEKITSEGLIDMKNKICQHVTMACKFLNSEKEWTGVLGRAVVLPYPAIHSRSSIVSQFQ